MRPSPEPEEGLPEELLDEQIVDLPSREALSIVDPGVFNITLPIGGTPDAPPTHTDGTDPAPVLRPEA